MIELIDKYSQYGSIVFGQVMNLTASYTSPSRSVGLGILVTAIAVDQTRTWRGSLRRRGLDGARGAIG